MFEKSLLNAARESITNLLFLHMNVLDMSFEAEFDAVFSNAAIHWIHDLARVYRLIHASLRPGGRIMIQTSIRERNALVETVLTVIRASAFAEYFRNMTLPWRFQTGDENRSLLGESGFIDIDVEEYHDRYSFSTIEECSGYLETAPMVPFLSILPGELHLGFRDLFLETYVEKNWRRLDITATRAFISARRGPVPGSLPDRR